MKALGIGHTTSVGIGGDPINGSSFLDILKLFEEDPETEAVMMIGEIGGPQEAEAALFVKENMTQAGDRLRRRAHRAQGPADGACRRDHLRLRRHRGREGRDHAHRRTDRGAESRGAGLHRGRGAGQASASRTTVAAMSARPIGGRDPPAARGGGAGAEPTTSTPGSTGTTAARAGRAPGCAADRRRASLHRDRQAHRRGPVAPSRGGPGCWPTSASASTTSTSTPPRRAGSRSRTRRTCSPTPPPTSRSRCC